MTSRPLPWFSPSVRRRVKTAGHPLRNAAIRRLHVQGVSIRKLAQWFGLSPTRIWEVCNGQGPPSGGASASAVGGGRRR